MKKLLIALLSVSLACHSVVAKAHSFPQKTVKIVVTFPPGGGTDLLARKLGDALEKRWKTPVLVENRPGASGNIGARYVAKSKADGYTLLMVNSSFAVNPGVYKELTFNPKTDFSPIVNVAWVPSIIVAPGNRSTTTLADALQPSSNHNDVAFASCGNGTPQHLAGEMLAQTTKMSLRHIPYNGCGAATNDILSGQLPIGIVTLSNAMNFIQNGKLQPLAVTSPERSPIVPEVPTVNEALKIKDYELNQWHGLLAPANTPIKEIDFINREVHAVLQDKAMQDELKNLGYTVADGNASEFTKIVHTDIDRFTKLAEKIGLVID